MFQPERVFVLLDARGTSDDQLLATYTNIVRSLGLPEGQVYRAERRRFTREGSGHRTVALLRPQDAGDIYRQSHYFRTLIVSTGAVRVLLDPRRDPATDRVVAKPSAVFRHKARVVTTGNSSTLGWEISLVLGQEIDTLTGAVDPRLLPLQLFGDLDEDGVLDTTVGRSQFSDRHRHRGCWRGSRGVWKDAAPGARHGHDRSMGAMTVCDWEVPVGLHWDVEQQCAGFEIVGLNEVWFVHRSGYANIYPDAYIRGGRDARRVWPTR